MFIMKKLTFNKQTIANLDNSDKIYGGLATLTPQPTGPGTVVKSVYECPPPQTDGCSNTAPGPCTCIRCAP
jgi:hypothetical protein